MHQFIIVDSAGAVTRSGTLVLESDIALQPTQSGETIIAGFSGRPGRDRWDGTRVVEIPVAPPTLAQRKAALTERLATRRWEVETGGVEASGALIRTDRESQAQLTGSILWLQRNPTSLIDWKSADGWISVGIEVLAPISDLVGSHVQRCFTRERVLQGLIEAATEADLPALAATVELFWPA